MGKMYTMEYTICSIDGIYNSKEEKKSLQKAIKACGNNDDKKREILSKFSMREIMASYQFGGLKHVYHLLPEEYKNDQELAFVACLNGDDISSRSRNLKRSYTLSCYLAHHVKGSLKYICEEHLTRNDSHLLKDYVENHFDGLKDVPKHLQTKGVIIQAIKYYRANQIRKFNCVKYPELRILGNIPEDLRNDSEIIFHALKTNPILLVDLDSKQVARQISHSSNISAIYIAYLDKLSTPIEKELANTSYSDSKKRNELRKQLRDIYSRKSILLDAQARHMNTEINSYERKRKKEQAKKEQKN